MNEEYLEKLLFRLERLNEIVEANILRDINLKNEIKALQIQSESIRINLYQLVNNMNKIN